MFLLSEDPLFPAINCRHGVLTPSGYANEESGCKWQNKFHQSVMRNDMGKNADTLRTASMSPVISSAE